MGQKYMKHKKAANTQWVDIETTGREGDGKTPVKRGAGKKAAGKKKSASASGKRKAKKDADDEEDQQDVEESPSKLIKAERRGVARARMRSRLRLSVLQSRQQHEREPSGPR